MFINQCANLLKIKDENGLVLFSADPKDLIIKKLENKKTIVSAKNLKYIQSHLEKINKERSSDEFQSRQGKIRNRGLLKFSTAEKEIIKDIEQSINPMYSHVLKQLDYVQKHLKDSLEELKRVVGVNDGNYWVQAEGGSGLTSNQDVRILEYMTGRPHYTTKNLRAAFEKIKTGPYSGISTSSVFHNKPGFHAQYIADIKPVTVKVKDKDGNIKEETREVLFQDNTWGASEMENTWIDSYGLKRTDYSDYRGGTLGYIVDENFRNGNFVNRILNEMTLIEPIDTTDNKLYKRIKNVDLNTLQWPQYNAVVLDGKSAELKSISDRIHDALFVHSLRYIEAIKDLAKDMSEEEIQSITTSLNDAGNSWETTWQIMKRRINPAFGPKITTKEQYDKLADSDYFKVLLEKVALKENGQLIGLEPGIARVKNVKDLAVYKTAQRNRAINTFKYSFGKNAKIIEYVTGIYSTKDNENFLEIIKKHNLNLTDEQISSIGKNIEVESDNYDGRISSLINLMMESIEADINKVITNKDAKKELQDFFRDYFKRNLYFNKSDINNPKITHLVKFIDRVFDPADDEEFVEIFRRIQDMSNEEFKTQILAKTNLEDLGLKNITGFDILKRLQHFEEDANNDFMNTIYYDSFAQDINPQSVKPTYTFEKLTRTPKYMKKPDFKDMYVDMYRDLEMLEMDKLFNKYKNSNITKYGAYPAYPKVNYLTEEVLNTSYNALTELLENKITMIKAIDEQVENYKIVDRLENYIKKLSFDSIPSEYQYKNINFYLGKLITLNYNDTSIPHVLEAAENAMELPKGTPWIEYLPYLNIIIRAMNAFENTTPAEILLQAKEQNKAEIQKTIKGFVEALIQKRYQNDITETINKLEQAIIKGDDEEKVSRLKEKLYEDFAKYHLLQNPKELLTQYLKSCIKDSDLNVYNDTYKALLNRGLNYARLSEVQEIIMSGLRKGNAINLKSVFDTYSIQLLGENFTMASEDMITYMINSLLIDNHQETALMFLDKLGLTETYIKAMASTFDYDEIKKHIIECHSLANNFNAFKNAIEPKIDEVSSLLAENGVDYTHLLNKLKREIKTAGIDAKLEVKELKPMLNAIDNIIYTCNENASADKSIIFNTLIPGAQSELANNIQATINSKNEFLSANTTMVNLINQLLLQDGSEANTLRDEINRKFKEIIEFKKSLTE